MKSKARRKDATVIRETTLQRRPAEEDLQLDAELEAELSRRPAPGTLARTKRLILAAVRVWELKRGFRP